MSERVNVRGKDYMVDLKLLEEGTPHTIGRLEKRVVRVGRVWEASVGGEVIGFVHYRLVTRERRTPGKQYVNARWHSPGWVAGDDRFSAPSWHEKFSRKDVLESLVRDWVES